MRWGWYPNAELSRRYVYLNTLEDDNPSLYFAAKGMINLGALLSENNNDRITKAVDFLQSMANAEMAREMEFMANKGLDDLSFENISDYIEKINEMIIGVEKYRTRIEYEKNRWDVKGRGAWSYTQAMGPYIQTAINSIEETGKKNLNSLSSVVREVIAEEVNKRCAGKGYTSEQLGAIFGSIQAFVMEDLERDKSGFLDKRYRYKEVYSKNKLKEYIRKDEMFNLLFSKEIFEDIKEKALSNVLGSFEVKSSKVKQKISEATEIEKKYENTITVRGEEIANQATNAVLETLGESTPKYYVFNRNTGMGGEFRSYLDGVLMEGIQTAWAGGKHGKADIVLYAGDIAIDDGKMEEYRQRALDKITAKTQSNFTEVGKAFSEYYQGMDEKGQQIVEELENLKNSFIIHESVKDYVTTNDLSSFHGFESGTWKGEDLIDAIDGMASMAGEAIDEDLIANVLLNLSPDAVGNNNEETLKRYLAMFIVMLSFDDGYTMVEQAMTEMPQTTLNALHLFNLNGIYVPSSVILKMVATNFKTILEEESDLSKLANISIDTGDLDFQGQLDALRGIYGHTRWRIISYYQMDAIEVRIRMLKNFRDIISSL